MKTDRERDELFRLARYCAEYNHKGCKCQCEKCGYNIYLYTNERDATLIKSNAYAEFQRHKELHQKIEAQKTADELAPLIGMGLIIGIISWACQACGG